MELGLNGPMIRTPGRRPASALTDSEHSVMSPVSTTPPLHPPSHLPVITLTINKDEGGYGMKVSGDNPVYVQSVKEGGAAEKAGLHSGDTILRVNGVDVAHSTHTEVVDLIKASSPVTLTVQPYPPPKSNNSHTIISSPTALSRPLLHHHNSMPARDRHVTGPQPVDHEKMRQFDNQRVHTIRLMLENEQRYVEKLRSDLARCTDSATEAKINSDLSGAERRVRTLHDQLQNQTAKSHAHSQGHHDNEPHGHTLPSPPNHNSLTAFLEGVREDPQMLPAMVLPNRKANRPLPQIPSPHTPPHPTHPIHVGLPGLSYGETPPLPPRQYLLQSPDGPPLSPTNNDSGQAPSSIQTHHRTKSSPDPLSNHTLSPAEASKRLIASESLSDLSNSKRMKGWDVDSPHGTPPGTPPPPYRGGVPSMASHSDSVDSSPALGDSTDDGSRCVLEETINDACSDGSHNRSRQQIISMEDDDMSDQEVGHSGDHGPFKSLSKLWQHNAHLAVFMSYVICNRDPSSLLFYLVTDLYKEGNLKEMKKWAYEILSSFLVPGAPLRLGNVDENLAREIDDVLLKESDKEEILRKVFWKARQKAKEEINDQLADFQQKHTAGLSTLFGPADHVLDESIHDKAKEIKIVESILLPKLEPFLEDIEKDVVDMRRYTTAAALGTIMAKTFGLRGPHSNTVLDRCPTFVSKDKSLKTRLIGRSRKVVIRGHNFVAHQYYTVTYCNHCQLIIWGIGPQGYQCSNCSLNVHRNCVKIVEENCPGPLVKKEKGNDRISKLMNVIRSEREQKRKPKRLQGGYVSQVTTPKMKGLSGRNRILRQVPDYRISLVRRHTDASDRDDTASGASADDHNQGERPATGGGRLSSGQTGAAALADRRPDSVTEERGLERLQGGQSPRDEDADTVKSFASQHSRKMAQHGQRSKPNSINRSESYKERVPTKRQPRERRKTSDPNLSKSNEADAEPPALSFNSGSSSNSSLSTRSLDSPSISLEAVVPSAANSAANSAAAAAALAASSATSATSASTTAPSAGTPAVVGGYSQHTEWDSDTEAEREPPDWTKGVGDDVLKSLSDREKKRQEVINELFHTERFFVRNLKVLDLVFYKPMKEAGVLSADQLSLVFANLGEMLEIHSQFNNRCKAIRRENSIVNGVGELLLSMFDGPAGEEFRAAAATFFSRLEIGLGFLAQERRKKDQKLNNFLTDLETNPLCRRWPLQDIIRAVIQRLMKYPLLLERLVKYTDESCHCQELESVQRALECSKDIATHVNGAVTLAEIQRRLDRSGFEKVEHPMTNEFKNLDLTKHRLVHEGALSWRIGNRSKLIDLHVLLLEDLIILLSRQDDRFLLKFHSVNTPGVVERTPSLSPIIKVSTVLVRPNATDHKAFYLINTSPNGAQIYDLVTTSSDEYKTWFRHFSEAAEKYKAQDGRKRRPEPSSTSTEEMKETALDKTKESEDDALGTPSGATEENNNAVPATTPTGTPPSVPSSPPHRKSSGDAAMSPTSHRLVEPLRLTTEGSSLIEPSEVVVSQRPVLTAEPVLSPIEQMRRNQEVVRKTLVENQQLAADILHVPREDFKAIAELAELAAQPNNKKEVSELVLAALNQSNQLLSVVNDSQIVTEEDAVAALASSSSPRSSRRRLPSIPAEVALDIATTLSSQLTELLRVWRDRDEERERMRRELQRSREQLHALHESQRRAGRGAGGVGGVVAGSHVSSQSRPQSCVSVGSTDGVGVCGDAAACGNSKREEEGEEDELRRRMSESPEKISDLCAGMGNLALRSGRPDGSTPPLSPKDKRKVSSSEDASAPAPAPGAERGSGPPH